VRSRERCRAGRSLVR